MPFRCSALIVEGLETFPDEKPHAVIMNRFSFIMFCSVAMFQRLVPASDAEWGHLTGRFRCDGQSTAAEVFSIKRDVAAFGRTIPDESLLIDGTNGGIANVVVYLIRETMDEPLAIHPSYTSAADSRLTLTMHGGRFKPHILLLRTTQSVTVRNRDNVLHNPRVDFLRNHPVASTAPGARAEWKGLQEERVPCRVSCVIHPWMRAYVLVRSNPYMACSDADGNFVIRNLPVGKHTFRLWHERTAYLKSTRVGSLQTDSRGRLTVMIQKGNNELPDIRIAGGRFISDE